MSARGPVRLLTLLLSTTVVMAGALVSPLTATAHAPAAATPARLTVRTVRTDAEPTRTSRLEARRVDRVPTPRLRWSTCLGDAQCTTVALPLDYDHPGGAKVGVALLRVPARDQAHKIGSLFVNPGGPGASATSMAYNAPSIFGPEVLDRFDIIGMDPRGTNSSQQVACFASTAQQAPMIADLSSAAFPVTGQEEQRFMHGGRLLARACSTTGRPLSASMSTAEVARDMDVVRRAVGDHRLNYLGFSYGSYLGQVYANLFPDRFRTMAIDGVVDPVAWAGTRATQDQPQLDRGRSADSAARALHEILARCARAGTSRCASAAGNPVRDFDLVARRLLRHPVVELDPISGEEVSFGYADLISTVLDDLYYADGYLDIESLLSILTVLTAPPSSATASTGQRGAAVTRLVRQLNRTERRSASRATLSSDRTGEEAYDNSLEATDTVLCTDSVNPARVSAYPAAADRADRRARYFGRQQVWMSVACARRSWTARDEDAYRGPFTRRTAATILVVGSLWDPATSYRGAVAAARLLPNSRLLTSDNWGHTAYGTSLCATAAIDRYLLTRSLPRRGARCTGDVQPFRPLTTSRHASGESAVQQLLRPLTTVTGTRRG